MGHVQEKAFVDLSHVIEAGMTTYRGLPGPQICDFWEREASAANYDDGSTFQIGRIDMIANTGTYVDSPFHRHADGCDLAGPHRTDLAVTHVGKSQLAERSSTGEQKALLLAITLAHADLVARCRIDTYNELEYYRAGGILQFVLRNLAA